MDGDVQLTKKQIVVGGAIIAALAILQPLKDWFVTREEGQAQDQRIAVLQHVIEETRIELTRTMERNTDKIIDRLNESEGRAQKNLEKLERRVETLEAGRLQRKSYY